MNTKTQTWHAERDDFLPASRMHRWRVKGNDGLIAFIIHKSDAVARERAALIAAAPDLLAALEALKKATFNPGMQYNLLSAARDQAQAAIELAKGHQGHVAGRSETPQTAA